MKLKALKLSEISYAIACLWIAASVAVFLWTLVTTQVSLNTAGRLYLVALAIVALAGVASAVIAQAKASALGLVSHRRFVLGPQPSDSQQRLAWRWGRVAINCWIVVMAGLLVLGLGLKTAFRP